MVWVFHFHILLFYQSFLSQGTMVPGAFPGLVNRYSVVVYVGLAPNEQSVAPEVTFFLASLWNETLENVLVFLNPEFVSKIDSEMQEVLLREIKSFNLLLKVNESNFPCDDVVGTEDMYTDPKVNTTRSNFTEDEDEWGEFFPVDPDEDESGELFPVDTDEDQGGELFPVDTDEDQGGELFPVNPDEDELLRDRPFFSNQPSASTNNTTGVIRNTSDDRTLATTSLSRQVDGKEERQSYANQSDLPFSHVHLEGSDQSSYVNSMETSGDVRRKASTFIGNPNPDLLRNPCMRHRVCIYHVQTMSKLEKKINEKAWMWKYVIYFAAYLPNQAPVDEDGLLDMSRTQSAIVDSAREKGFQVLEDAVGALFFLLDPSELDENVFSPKKGRPKEPELDQSSLEPLQIHEWDWQRYIGLGLFSFTVVVTITIVAVGALRRRRRELVRTWGVLGTEEGVSRLLETGWVIDGDQMHVYDKSSGFLLCNSGEVQGNVNDIGRSFQPVPSQIEAEILMTTLR